MSANLLLRQVLDALKKTPGDGLVYLAAPIDNHSAFFTCNNLILFASFSEELSKSEEIETRLLALQTGITISPTGETASYPSRKYDIIRLKSTTDNRILETFVTLCSAYSDSSNSMLFSDFFFAIADLFRPDRADSKRSAVGLYGELVFIKQSWDHFKVDAARNWQLSGQSSKLDFVFDDRNIEVKTTTKESDLVFLNHEQLFSSTGTYLYFVKLKKDPGGQSLLDLSEELKSSGCLVTLQSQITLEHELMKIEIEDVNTKYSVSKTKLFLADTLNFLERPDERITQLTYYLNLAGIPETPFNTFFDD